jgi:flagellar basal body rod protein FlgC
MIVRSHSPTRRKEKKQQIRKPIKRPRNKSLENVKKPIQLRHSQKIKTDFLNSTGKFSKYSKTSKKVKCSNKNELKKSKIDNTRKQEIWKRPNSLKKKYEPKHPKRVNKKEVKLRSIDKKRSEDKLKKNYYLPKTKSNIT